MDPARVFVTDEAIVGASRSRVASARQGPTRLPRAERRRRMRTAAVCLVVFAAACSDDSPSSPVAPTNPSPPHRVSRSPERVISEAAPEGSMTEEGFASSAACCRSPKEPDRDSGSSTASRSQAHYFSAATDMKGGHS